MKLNNDIETNERLYKRENMRTIYIPINYSWFFFGKCELYNVLTVLLSITHFLNCFNNENNFGNSEVRNY